MRIKILIAIVECYCESVRRERSFLKPGERVVHVENGVVALEIAHLLLEMFWCNEFAAMVVESAIHVGRDAVIE